MALIFHCGGADGPPGLLQTTMFRPLLLRSSLRFVVPRTGRGIAGSSPQLPAHGHGHLLSSHSPITSSLHFFNSVTSGDKQIPTYRVIDGAGQPLEGAQVPDVRFLSRSTIQRMTVIEGPP